MKPSREKILEWVGHAPMPIHELAAWLECRPRDIEDLLERMAHEGTIQILRTAGGSIRDRERRIVLAERAP